jgi:DMSO/TMAO reductase YedYZ heme-binding membrane subunit
MNEAAAAPALTRRKAALGTAGVSLAAIGLVILLAAQPSWLVARELMRSRGTGWVALVALLLSLSCTPVARLAARFGYDRIRALGIARRALGMASAWLALLHAGLALATSLQWNFTALLHWPHLRAGLTALGLLLVLLATSFSTIVVRLRLAFFKELHRLGYVAALLAMQHMLLSPFAPRTLTLLIFGATFLLGLLHFL